MKNIDRVKTVVSIIARLSVIFAVAIAIQEGNWTYVGLSFVTLLVMLIPSIIEKSLRFNIPNFFEVLLILFIYAAIFLGSSNKFYSIFWWWDILVHGFSGLICGNIGFLIVNYLNSSSKISIALSPTFVSLFSFCFAVAIGALWEIYEFIMDKLFNTFMQNGSLHDTMLDLILDTLGALIFIVFVHYRQNRKGKHILYRK